MLPQGISFLLEMDVKQTLRFLLLAATPLLFVSAQQVSAVPVAPKNSTDAVRPQSSNPASSHDRHNRRNGHGKRHRRRRTASKH
jgi:hypothetical protein